jgi:hypothetical protein
VVAVGLRHGDKASDKARVRSVFSAVRIRVMAPPYHARALPAVSTESSR